MPLGTNTVAGPHRLIRRLPFPNVDERPFTIGFGHVPKVSGYRKGMPELS